MKLSMFLIVLASLTSGSRTKRTIADLDQLDQARFKDSFFHLDGDFSDTLETELDNAQWRRRNHLQPKSKREAPEAEAVKDQGERNAVDPCGVAMAKQIRIKRKPSLLRSLASSRVVDLASSVLSSSKKLAIPPKFSRKIRNV